MAAGKKRIYLLDELRGLAVFCMVFYHAFYSMSEFFGFEIGTKLLDFFTPAEPFFAALFIVISAEIYFGILHLLSLSMLIFSALRAGLDKINPIVGFVLCIVIYILTYGVSAGFVGIAGLKTFALPAALYKTNYFMPLGFFNSSFHSADYFPLLPHLFMFLAGTFIGIYAANGRFPAFTYRRRSRALCFLGRHALVIYIAHQPIIYGILWVVEKIIAK